jgi:hypothetical protein
MTTSEKFCEDVARALRAYRAAGSRYQGFFYGNSLHVIRDMTKPWTEQKVWERKGSGHDYDAAHEAMMEEIEHLKMKDAITEALKD